MVMESIHPNTCRFKQTCLVEDDRKHHIKDRHGHNDEVEHVPAVPLKQLPRCARSSQEYFDEKQEGKRGVDVEANRLSNLGHSSVNRHQSNRVGDNACCDESFEGLVGHAVVNS